MGRHRSLAWTLMVALVGLGCDGSLSGPRGDAAVEDLGGPPGPPDLGRPMEVDFGLDTRPVNSTCFVPDRPTAGGEIALGTEEAFPALPMLVFPLFLTQAPGSPDRFYIVEKTGRVITLTGDGSDWSVFIDIQGRVLSDPAETGLLGMAFHPEFERNGEVFLSYTARSGGIESRVARFRSSDDGLTADPATEEVVLRVGQFADNHNGGWIGFGPDRLLYLGLGDGGGGGDPEEHGQNPRTLLGSVVRIDVDGAAPYGIPPDNPFADGRDGAPEVYAWGLRNPWRMSFDRLTGELWAGDVGQSAREEVDIIVRGGNYGWNTREGDLCFDERDGCDTPGLIEPVHAYGRGDGVSVTGGYVYRGQDLGSDLFGVYLFSDHLTGSLWGLFPDGAGGYERRTLRGNVGLPIASFGEGLDGELYALHLFNEDQVFRVVRTTPAPSGGPPPLLSQTGCMDPLDPARPGPALIPYAPTATLWSDGADKERWVALPEGTQISIGPDGDFGFPTGTVLVKQFRFRGRLVETRFYVRFEDGAWGGYTYRWNDAQTDAVLLEGAGEVQVGDATWAIPTRAQCDQCHTEAAGRSLGLEIAQLNAPFVYPGNLQANQLRTLEHIGVIEALPGPVDSLDAFPAYEDASADVGARARGYLHSNCSVCHRPGAQGGGNLDLRYATELAATGACDEPPRDGDLGLPDARVVATGAPERSVLLERMLREEGDGRMPPLATVEVDAVGTGLLRDWISGLSGCE